MSKKLIAVASAAALALAGLVGIAPANATVGVVFNKVTAINTDTSALTTTAQTAPLTAATALSAIVPDQNALYYDETATTNTLKRDRALVQVVVTTPANNTTVTATGTGAIRFIDVETTSVNKYNAASGKTTHTVTPTGSAVSTFYVYSTSTATETFTISYSGFSSTYYFKGTVGLDYNVSVVAPSFIAQSSTADVLITVTDVFGNAKENDSDTATAIGTPTVSPSTAVSAAASAWDATKLAYKAVLTATADGGQFSLSVSVAATNVTGLPVAKNTFFAALNAANPNTAVNALTAQVAALQAQLADMRTKARSVTKKKYNTLARKWNAANPGARVALKK